LPDGVTLSTDPEEVVALVSETSEEPEEGEGEEMSVEDVAVEQKGKQEESDEQEQ
jgi:hypothetical protein